ncbi:MAG: CinA family protein [Clostridia bacterium]|nr:CinA family protein [Clostridia bacterium]
MISDNRVKKNCLLFLRNKRVNDFTPVEAVIQQCASHGYYFDSVVYAAYDSSFEITTALNSALKNYENTVIICPKVMENTIKKYIVNGHGGEFSELGVFKYDNLNTFILFSDTANRLQVSDICTILNKKYNERYERAYIKTVGAPNMLLNSAIAEIKKCCPKSYVNVSEKYGDCSIEIVYDCNTSKSALDNGIRAALVILNDYVYTLDNSSLNERLVQLLKLRRLKISVAESFTGGGIGKRLVDIPGVSEVYFEGLNTYSNEAKIARLGIDENVLAEYGAVSGEVAMQMAEGLIKTGNCDVSIATTGIAGPKSDNTKKPVGLLYIAVSTADGTNVFEYNLKGSRESITQTAINLAMFEAYKRIK